MGVKETPSTLAEALAAETGEPSEAYEMSDRDVPRLEEATAAPDEIDHTPDERPIAFSEIDLDDATELSE